MLLSVQWLKEFTPFEGSIQELSDRLTMLGLEVEEHRHPFDHLKPVVVGHVISCTKHPQADKLSLCSVDIGDGEPLSIVCGAPNVAQGQKVAVAPVGTQLSDDLKIKKAKIRGEQSFGMICAEDELGLGSDHSGILVLDDNAPIGQSIIETLTLDNDVLDLSITPNRADCLSVVGIARDVAVGFNLPLTLPTADIREEGEDISSKIVIDIPESTYCPVYRARLIKDITVKPAPAWMRYRLVAVGLRPINNMVDVTNYILMELGQPQHAFDYDLISGNTISIAPAKKGDELVTLDGQARKLVQEDLLILDKSGPIALAGVMGGASTEIHEKSTNVLLECAVFHPATIRKTARRLALHSEASHRFERGVDQPGSLLAMNRAAMFMAEFGGGTLSPGIAVNEPQPYTSNTLPFRAAKAASFLSLPLDTSFCETTLKALGCSVEDADKKSWTITPPSHRLDLEREVDLFEEVGRVYGLDRVPPILPRVKKSLDSIGEEDTTFTFLTSLKRWARGLGLTEVINYSFVSSKELDLLGQPVEERVHICNPLSEEQNVMRTVLAPGLLQNLKLNLGHGNRNLKLFEVAHTFFEDKKSETHTREENWLALLLYGSRFQGKWPWKTEQMDFLDLKGLVEHLVHHLGLPEAQFTRTENHPYLSPCVSCSIGDIILGVLGQVKEPIAKEYHAVDGVFLAELNLETLHKLRHDTAVCFSALPKFPPIRRDMTLVAPRTLQLDALYKAVEKAKPAILEKTELIDVFQPDKGDSHNLTFRFTYRHSKKTLKDKEVDKLHDQLGQAIVQALPVSFQ